MKSRLLKKVSRDFNHFRSPECRANVIENNGEILKVKFTGTASTFSCCFDEHFEDYRLILEENGIKTEIEKVERKSMEKFIVLYVMHG